MDASLFNNPVFIRVYYYFRAHAYVLLWGSVQRENFENKHLDQCDTGAAVGLTPSLLRLDDLKKFYLC